MRTKSMINIQEAARILNISTRTLHERIKSGYYETMRVGTILVDPKTHRPLTENDLRSIPIRSKGRPPGKYGKYRRRKRARLSQTD